MAKLSFIQSVSYPTTFGSTTSITVPKSIIDTTDEPVPVHNDILIVCVITNSVSNPPPKVSDDQGTTYTLADSVLYSVSGNDIGSSSATYVFVGIVSFVNSPIVTATSNGYDVIGVSVSHFTTDQDSLIDIIAHNHALFSQDMSVELKWSPGLVGLVFGVAVAGGYPQGESTSANNYTVIENHITTYRCPGFTTFYRANDVSGTATPSIHFQSGTYGSIIGIIITASDKTNQLYLSGPTTGIEGYPTSLYTLRLGAVANKDVIVSIVSDSFSPISVTIPIGSAQASFSFTPTNITGSHNISVSAPGYTVNNSPLPITIVSIPTGSLHITNQYLLNSSDILGKISNPSIGLRWQVDKIAGVTQGYTIIADWSNRYNNTSFIVWHPCTRQLVITIHGMGGSWVLTSTIPIQLGVGYYFLVVITSTTATLYINRVAHLSVPTNGQPIYNYSGIVFGGDAGENVVLDHYISDMGIWNTPVTEIDGLATGEINALQTTTPAVAWWPVGEMDYTGNNNNLTPITSNKSVSIGKILKLGSPVIVSGLVSTWGLVRIGVTPVNGGVSPITDFSIEPIVKVNNKIIAMDWTWYSETKDSPFIAGAPLCGAIEDIAIEDGGAGWVDPVVSVDNNTITLGKPILATGIVTYNVTTTKPYKTLPSVAVGRPSNYNVGPHSPIGATPAVSLDANGNLVLTPLVGGLLGCGERYDPANPPSVTITGGDGVATAIAVVDTYIKYVPVINGGSDLTERPKFLVTDKNTPKRQASLLAIMAGITVSDTVTCDWSSGFITATLDGLPIGGIQAATNIPVINSVGRREPSQPGFEAPSVTTPFVAGANIGEQPSPWYVQFTAKNTYLCGLPWQTTGATPGTLTTESDGTPISWTNPTGTILDRWCQGPASDNHIDGMGWPGRWGRWKLRYPDPYVNTAKATALWSSGVPVNLSGPNLGTTTPIVVDPSDINFIYGQGLTSVTLAHTDTGSNWQGAIIRVTGGNGYSAVLIPIISNGKITDLLIICPGWAFVTKPLIQIWGTEVEGNVTTSVIECMLSDQSTSWELALHLYAAQIDGQWNLLDKPWLVAPDAIPHEPQSIDPSKPLDTDDSVIAQLFGIGATRWMDVTLGYGGGSNFTWSFDTLDPNSTNWYDPRNAGVRFRYVRRVNSTSMKIYGDQGYCTNHDPSFTITGDTVSGSKTIINLSSNSLIVGSHIEGDGVPIGTLITSIKNNTLTVSKSCTISNSNTTLTITKPTYFALPPDDNGAFMAYDQYAQGYQSVVMELRSEGPHNLSTSPFASMWVEANGKAIPITNTIADYAPTIPNGDHIWVTGYDTILISAYLLGGPLKSNLPASYIPQHVDSDTEIDLGTPGWLVYYSLPFSPFCVPQEYPPEMVSRLDGATLWSNLPSGATRDFCYSLGYNTAIRIGPDSDVILEYGNEWWNGGNIYRNYPVKVGKLLSYLPKGTVVDNYVADGNVPAFDTYGTATIIWAGNCDKYVEGWVEAELDPSRVKRAMGTFWNIPIYTQQILESCQYRGIPIDYIAGAPYMQMPNDTPIVRVCSPAGAMPNAGSWPVRLINDLFRNWMTESSYNRALLEQNAAACAAFGQPVRPLLLSRIPGGGKLVGATYRACCTYVDDQGNETTRGLSDSNTVDIADNDTLGVIMPGLPPWVVIMNIYLTVGDSGSETYYMPVNSAEYSMGSTILLTDKFIYSNRVPSVINNAAFRTPVLPTTVAYEGGNTSPISDKVLCRVQIWHDAIMHPSNRDSVRGWFDAQRRGKMTLALFYQLYFGPDYNGWSLANGPGQPAGDGLGHIFAFDKVFDYHTANQCATIQGHILGTPPPDGHDHNGGPNANVSTGLLGLRDRYKTITSLPSPLFPKRHWFASRGRGRR